MGSKERGWWLDVWGGAAVSMVTCWGSFSDGLHHPHPGVRLCVPPGGPPHLHGAAQVCSHDGIAPAKFVLESVAQEESYSVCFYAWLITTLVTCTASPFYFEMCCRRLYRGAWC